MTDTYQKFGLGTVQWGVDYGISNVRGQTSASEVGEILAMARKSGITLLDTAAQYGSAEATLGEHCLAGFKVVTKTPHFGSPVFGLEHQCLLRGCFAESLTRLNSKSVYGLLVHNAPDLLVPGASLLLSTLEQLKADGLVAKIGVSVYNGEQLNALLGIFTPDIIQLPLSVFDQRLLNSGHISRLKELGVEIHVRSVFLQGLLLMKPADLPAGLLQYQSTIERWRDLASEQGLTPRQAALTFVRDIQEVDQIVVGVESVEQLLECLTDYSINRSFDCSEFDVRDATLLNPALWGL